MVGTIYCYYINNKYYIGKTYTKERQRIKQHKYDANHNGKTPFCHAIRKYGWENVLKSYQVLERIEGDNLEELNEILCDREIYWIKEKNSLVPNGYNVVFSNQKKPPYTANMDEVRQKLSKALKGKYMNQEYSSKKVLCVETNKVYPSVSECERQMGFKHNTIGAVLRGKHSHHQGYTFKYIDEETTLKPKSDRNKNIICLETNEIFKNSRELSIDLCGSEKIRPNIMSACKYGWAVRGKHYRRIVNGNIVPSVQYSRKNKGVSTIESVATEKDDCE